MQAAGVSCLQDLMPDLTYTQLQQGTDLRQKQYRPHCPDPVLGSPQEARPEGAWLAGSASGAPAISQPAEQPQNVIIC